jgi:ABC-type oligopeptide transport system ATPase subunit
MTNKIQNPNDKYIVRCQNIIKSFYSRIGRVKAVDDVSLEINKGEILGLVGESGSGKTTLGKIILGIVRPDSGKVELNTENPQVIFQDPYNSLDPKMRVADIVAEGLMLQGRAKGQGPEVREKIEEILELVRIPRAALKKYPHEFSGGERQRIAIARALVTEPEFIVCDEPVSSLDVTIQLGILNILRDVHKAFGITYLFISHDLRAVRFMCDRVIVMKDGKIVEEGAVVDIYKKPNHPYTRELISSILDIANG